MKNIFCIGGASIDHKLKSSVPLISGTSNPVLSVTSFGGVARNVAENLARWSHNIHLQCVVGDDNDGEQLLTFMQQLGVNTHESLKLPQHTTSHYYAVLNPTGELHIALADMDIYNNIPAAFTQSWQHWPETSIVFIDTNLSTTLIEHAITQSKNKKHLLCIDPVSVTKSAKLPSLLEGVFLIKPNQQEASTLTNMSIHSLSDCIKAGHILLDRGVKNVVISLGEAGYVIVNAHLQKHFQSHKHHPVQDVNGAGDAFVAGILFGLQQNVSLPEACQVGAAAAALTLESHHSVAQTINAKQLIKINEDKKTKDLMHASLF